MIRPRLILFMVCFALICVPNISAQNIDPIDRATQNIFADMTPQQKIGQLLVVTFDGSYLGEDADIIRLISDYQIGGVLLTAQNDNINGRTQTSERVLALTTGLQRTAYQTSQDQNLPYLPLLIATTHNGNGLPQTQIATETSPLPSYMALGATWNPSYAHQVGQVAGEELSAMGINMLLGPALDVAGSSDILGVQTFGGEPFWVGQMGAEYIRGVHEGSSNRILVFPRHLPGLGGSDRQLTQEVPVVPRSVEELRRFDLIPFFRVTGEANDPLSTADGLQCANIRYQGENIRSETRPVCVDETAFRAVMSQPRYGDWREYGLILSDGLGTRAIRRWYDIDPFPHRQVARDSLLAGNDLLLLADFGVQPDSRAFDNIVDTIRFFTEGYLTDPLFAARVDEAVQRIIRQKLELYGNPISYETVTTLPHDLNAIGKNALPMFEIARNAVTLISPQPEQLLPPPQINETILIFSDTRPQQQCSYCRPQAIIPQQALQDTIQNLYGEAGSGQVNNNLLVSYSLNDLAEFLDVYVDLPVTVNAPLGESLSGDLPQADWIIFAILDNNPQWASVETVRQFLEIRSDFISSRTRIVVFALAAPYYLSPTDISKLSAYYGLFGHTQPFIDAVARALFQEVPLRGALPVSLQAINYNVFEATSPDPRQSIRMEVSKADSSDLEAVKVGDTLIIETEPILDRNGNIVPDGTPAIFTLSFVSEGVQTQQDAATLNGIAQASFILRRAGQVQIRVTSVDAVSSVTFEITVDEDELAALQTVIPSTPTPTDTPSLTPTDTPSSTPTDTPSATPTDTPSFTPTDTPTDTPSFTPTDTPTDTPSSTPTDTPTDTPSFTPTDTPSSTPTDTPSFTPTDTPSSTPTNTPTATDIPTEIALVPTPVTTTSTVIETIPRPVVTVSDFLLSLTVLIILIIPAVTAGWATSRSLDGTVRIVLGTLVAGLVGYVYYGSGAPGASLLQNALQDLAAMLITFLSGAAGLVFTWWTVRQIQ